MGLEFTSIPDREGAAIYFICDGTPQGEQELRTIYDELATQHLRAQLVWVGDTRSHDARKIIDFYDLKGSKFVLIVRDNDQLHHVWSDGERFDPARIAYVARQAG